MYCVGYKCELYEGKEESKHGVVSLWLPQSSKKAATEKMVLQPLDPTC